MKALQPFISKLRRLEYIIGRDFLSRTLDSSLPTIVLLGSSSSGKTSVLQSILGLDIFPVNSPDSSNSPPSPTRRPVIIQLVCEPETSFCASLHDTLSPEYCCESLATPSDVQEALASTLKATPFDSDGQLVDCPIRLRLCSSEFVDLTLVDLPGIQRRMPCYGRPTNRPEISHEIGRKYIRRGEKEKKDCLVLVVVSGNVDVAADEGLHLAKVNMNGLKTIGVLSKVDLVSAPYEEFVRDVIVGEICPLRLGYCAVVNRGSLLPRSMSLEEASTKETEFFRNHRLYGPYSSNQGILGLFNRIDRFFLNEMKDSLPVMKEEVRQLLRHGTERLSTCCDDDSDRRRLGIEKVLEALTEANGLVADLANFELPKLTCDDLPFRGQEWCWDSGRSEKERIDWLLTFPLRNCFRFSMFEISSRLFGISLRMWICLYSAA